MIGPIVAAALMQIAAPAAVPMDRTGDWAGTLTLPSGATLEIAVHLNVAQDGRLRGSFDSIDQRVWDQPVNTVVMTATTLTFGLRGNAGGYSGRWDAATRRWIGIWSQGGTDFPLTLSAGGPSPRPAVAAAAWTLPADVEIGEIVERRIARRPGAAMVVGVIDANGRRIVARGATPAGADTLFEIGSITKVFTGLLLADMAARGEVSLDDPVAKYLPAGWSLPSRGRVITLLDLATHRSGLPRVPLNMPFSDESNPYADYTPALMRDFLKTWVPGRAPGAAYEYSNLGVALLGQALARRTGTDYETLVRRRITGPLRMADTRARGDGGALTRQATPHDEFLRPVPPWGGGVMAPAGGLRSNVPDMLSFLGAHLGLTPTPLRAPMDAMRVKRAEGESDDVAMGIGWMIAKARTGAIVTHSGATGGYLTIVAFDPDRRRGVVVLTNAMTQPGVDDLALHILTGSPVTPTPPPPPAPAVRSVVALSPAALDRFIGRYRLPPDQVITVFRSGDRLMIQLIGQQALPIYPTGPRDFFAKIVPVELTFRTTAGGVDALVLRQDGGEKLAPRIADR